MYFNEIDNDAMCQNVGDIFSYNAVDFIQVCVAPMVVIQHDGYEIQVKSQFSTYKCDTGENLKDIKPEWVVKNILKWQAKKCSVDNLAACEKFNNLLKYLSELNIWDDKIR